MDLNLNNLENFLVILMQAVFVSHWYWTEKALHFSGYIRNICFAQAWLLTLVVHQAQSLGWEQAGQKANTQRLAYTTESESISSSRKA